MVVAMICVPHSSVTTTDATHCEDLYSAPGQDLMPIVQGVKLLTDNEKSWCSICLELFSNSVKIDYEIVSVASLGPWLLLCPWSARSLFPPGVPSHLYSPPHQIDRRRRKE